MGMERFGHNSEGERPPIPMTEEEFKQFQTLDVDDPRLIELLTRKGISPGAGNIEIDVNGEKITITTDREDFGTTIN